MKVACNHCGNALEIPDLNIRFITCTACSSQLTIEQGTNALYTKVAQANEAYSTTNNDGSLLHHKIDLERLEREWNEEKAERFMVKWQYGDQLISEKLCNNEKVKFKTLLVISLLMFMSSWVAIDSLPKWSPLLLAVISISLPISSFFRNQSLAQQLIDFEAAEAKYQEKKRTLVAKIEGEQ
jgi:ribosomal protein S27E